MHKSKVCVIPARGGSKGVANKNIIDLNGKPLIYYSIIAAIESGIFDDVVVYTDSKKIAKIARIYGATVPFARPSNVSQDDSLVEDTIECLLRSMQDIGCKYDYICLLQATSPLVVSQDIKNAMDMIEEKDADMVVSVTKNNFNEKWIGYLAEDGSMKDFFLNSPYGTLRQNSKESYMLNGSIYFGKYDIFYNKKNYYKSNIYSYVMPVERSVDIDTKFDLEVARSLIRNRK